ncbi:MAG: tRNA 2-thiouridine(34) synthase MnmA [Erysipelotrichaceae bacterium]|nr:tRNA 2-thiouridine(34) synthase MnmA [Erysipelotrichaceae bacterium]
MKILVGLSGGVDSAVAAYLLQQQGHEVACAFMRNWDASLNNDILGNPTLQNAICPQEEDYNDAKAVADRLGLPLYRIDFIKEYWDEVFTTFLTEYQLGRTPNPDILCNKYIKFSSFMKYAEELGYPYIATGHYAKIARINNICQLLKADDRNKDQSYFLCQIPKEALEKIVFPLAELDKHEVRRIASELNLSIAAKKDSTGICFIGERNFREFLMNYLPAKEGFIVNIDNNKIIGRHTGVLYYTIGQRKGLSIGGPGGPWFVIGKDVKQNILYVAEKETNSWLKSESCLVTGFNWLTAERPSECTAKFRYRQQDHPVQIRYQDEQTLIVEYPQQISGVTPGQEAVLYRQDICLGGGVIMDVYHQRLSLNERIKGATNVSIQPN